MKIAMTIEVPDEARRYIAQLSDGETTETTGLATREACVAYFQTVVATLSRDGSLLPTGKLTEEEAQDAELAVQYLRKQGKTDGQIRAWLLLQRARLVEPLRAAG
jgi:hypothetical protein